MSSPGITMKGIDALRAKADEAVETYRKAVKERDQAQRDLMAQPVPSFHMSGLWAEHKTAIVVAYLKLAECNAKVQEAQVDKYFAEQDVLSALCQWWDQGCKSVDNLEEFVAKLLDPACPPIPLMVKSRREQVEGLLQEAARTYLERHDNVDGPG